MIDLSAEERARRGLGRLMFIARWIMVPVYLGLLGALALVAVKFVQRLIEVVPNLLQQDSTETIISALSLVDLSLVANLIVIIIFAGWQNFVARFQSAASGEQPDPFMSL
ncbi:MAG TPA: YqhA family protein, partial [Rhodopila sp.]|nr:YqhA family protein [Rhodopila sp.]